MSVPTIARPVKVSANLAKVIGTSVTTRAEALKGVWSYIKSKNLQDPAAKTIIKCDELLKSTFGVDSFKQTEIMGLISKQVEKGADAGAAAPKMQ